jgi:molybdopterin synthase catalytic subunit
MKIRVEITREPLVARGVTGPENGAGAVVVRGEEDGRTIAGLDYEAYEPMARSEMERLAGELSAVYPCYSMEVMHRIGHVPAGAASILVRVEAKHRAEAFGMLAEFMNRLKREVPIWKKVAT